VSRGRVIVLGATGQIGIFAIPRLLAAGFEVVAVSRRARPVWYPEFARVQWVRLEAVGSGAAADGTLLLSAGPMEVAIRLVEACPGLERAVVFSTSSVFSKLESHDRKEKRHMQRIVMDEARLSSLCEGRGIALSLFRPTLIYGCGIDGNVSWLARWIRKFGMIPVAGQAAGLRQPVHAEDLAKVAVTALSSESPLALDVPLCGGSTLSFREMIERIFHALGRPVRIVSLPRGLFTALIRIGRLHPRLRNVRPEMVRREAKDLVFDDTTPRQVLGYEPRPFRPGAADFRLPDGHYLRELAES
jgi:nucleoside-diphosphate-sugar epimerase